MVIETFFCFAQSLSLILAKQYTPALPIAREQNKILRIPVFLDT